MLGKPLMLGELNMGWLYLVILLSLIVGLGILFEKRGKGGMNDADITREEKENLDEDYLKKGKTNITDDADKL